MKIQSIDDAVVFLEHVRNMLQLFEEHMEDELVFLKKDGDAVARHFVSRYDLLRSQLDIIQFGVQDVAAGLGGIAE